MYCKKDCFGCTAVVRQAKSGTQFEHRMNNGTLYLVPVPLAESVPIGALSPSVKTLVAGINIFVVENAKTARQWLKWYEHPMEMRQLTINELKEVDGRKALSAYLTPLMEGKSIGLMSEAGCPGIADPGANLVREAHRLGVRVVPLVGPSSILLALMASGLNGQRFCFHGYLPVDRIQRAKAITALEQRSHRDRETQIFIETPYRNSAMINALVATCNVETLLCMAANVTDENEMIATRTIGEWRKQLPDLDKRPTVFLLMA
jgi:16S rRNA (cytidine1402-2'-O)-methyltransferase